MWSKEAYLILFLIFSISHFVKATDIDNCCRYGFEDGVKLNMLRENKKWSVIRSKNFAYCETNIMFGKDAFRRCKTIGEEMALSCTIGRNYALMGIDCDVLRDEHPTVYTCCMTCLNSRSFGEEQFDLFNKNIEKYGEELFENKSLYNEILNQIDINKQCNMLNLVFLVPELQLFTFNQCCRSWNYNYNQHYYPDHFNVNDICSRINVCLDKQNHTEFDFDKFTDSKKDFVQLRTKNIMKIIQKQMEYEQKSLDSHFAEIVLNGSSEIEVVTLRNDQKSSDDFHEKKLRSIDEERAFHSNISSYKLNLRRVPKEKLKYHYCNKMCKKFDYNESLNSTNLSPKDNSQCFYNFNQQFCAKAIECEIGYFANHNNTRCVELNECDMNLDDCLPEIEYCVDHYDGYTCECKNGSRYDQLTGKCTNINECEEIKNICPPLSYCIDLEGSYECKCYEGLFKDAYDRCLPFPSNRIKNNTKMKLNPQKANTYNDDQNFSLESKPTESYDLKLLITNQESEKKILEGNQLKNVESTDLIRDEKNLVKSKIIQETTNHDLLENYHQIINEKSTDNLIINSSINKTSIEPENLSSIASENKLFNGNLLHKNLLNNQSLDKSSDKESEKIGEKEFHKFVSTTETNSINQWSPLIHKNQTSSVVIKSSEKSEILPNSNKFSSSNIEPQSELREIIIENLCPQGYTYSEIRPRKCVDINECLDSTLHNCQANQTCVNLEGSFQCQPKENCPKDYKEINVNIFPSEHYQETSTRTSTICKYVHSRDFESEKERLSFEKSNAIIQFISYETIGLPYRNDSTGYVQIYEDKTIEKADGNRFRPNGIALYLVDKSKKSIEMNLNYKAQFQIVSTTCSERYLSNKFQLSELNSNVFAIIMLEQIRESCSIDFSIDIQTTFVMQNFNYNREIYNVHLIIYQYEQYFTISAKLK